MFTRSLPTQMTKMTQSVTTSMFYTTLAAQTRLLWNMPQLKKEYICTTVTPKQVNLLLRMQIVIFATTANGLKVDRIYVLFLIIIRYCQPKHLKRCAHCKIVQIFYNN